MCGVIGGYIGQPKVLKGQVKGIYEEQKTRGRNGYGLGIRKPDGTMLRDRAISDTVIFRSKLWKEVEAGDYFVFHHRLPTSTFNTPECNHPIMNEDGSIMVVHNGTIIDKIELRQEHEFETQIKTVLYSRSGIVGQHYDWTDTEEIVHLFEELRIKKSMAETLQILGSKSRSTYLFLTASEEGLVFVGRSMPLWAYRIGGNVFLASEKGILNGCKELATDCEPSYGRLREYTLSKTKCTWPNNFCNYPGGVWKASGRGGYAYVREESKDEITTSDRTMIELEDTKKVVKKKKLEEELEKLQKATTTTTAIAKTQLASAPALYLGKSKKELKREEKRRRKWWKSFAQNRDACITNELMAEAMEVARIGVLEEAESGIDERIWEERCRQAGIKMSRSAHSQLFPGCDGECLECVEFSCPLNPIHASGRYAYTNQP